MPATTLFLCPICQLPLTLNATSFCCDNKHNFDIAKEGYVNLLPVQYKKSKQPGDNKAMIQARKRFLEQGFYDILITPCAELINKYLTAAEQHNLLDTGCGDGYFTKRIFDLVTTPHNSYGMDISKEAVKSSTNRDHCFHWFVASSRNIPLLAASIDCILKINSPLDYSAVVSKLSQTGTIVSVVPGAKHLHQLKSLIYATVRLHDPELQPEGYKLLDSVNLSDTITLQTNREIEQLFMMTPFYWNAPQAAKHKILQLNQLSTEIAFTINVWQQN